MLISNDPHLLQSADAGLVERILDIHYFLITFHTPISISAPHTYIPKQVFIPSHSLLSATFGRELTKE
jgi:hypothetical protein